MAAPPKKMMAPLGHAPPQREGPDRTPQSHMILPSGMSCPPLVRTHTKNIYVYFYKVTILKKSLRSLGDVMSFILKGTEAFLKQLNVFILFPLFFFLAHPEGR